MQSLLDGWRLKEGGTYFKLIQEKFQNLTVSNVLPYYFPTLLVIFIVSLFAYLFYIMTKVSQWDASFWDVTLITHCLKSVQIRSIFWSVFSSIRTECGDLRSKSLYSVPMRENTDQKKLCIWTLFTQWPGVTWRRRRLFWPEYETVWCLLEGGTCFRPSAS